MFFPNNILTVNDESFSAHSASAILEPHVLSANTELCQYLDEYATADNECPEFAVGIYGNWGMGKSFFIREWLKHRHISHCYLSLFGISTTDAIEQAIFKNEHPFLSSPKLKMSMDILSIFSKNSQFTKEFSPLVAGLHDDLKKLVNNLTEHVATSPSTSCSRPLLIFDDVERTSLPYPILFGYLSMLLQCRGYKIVLLYNQGKLADIYEKQTNALNEDKALSQTFQDLFQKAVGIEFPFNGDAEDALRTIFSQHPELLNVQLFTEILKQTGNNLRRVKQALWQFKHRWPSRADILFSAKQKQAIFSIYLAVACTFSNPKSEQISHFAEPLLLDSKHNDLNFYDQYGSILPADFKCPLSPHLMAVLVKWNTPQKELLRQIDSYIETINKENPAWRTLMNAHFSSKDQLYKAIDTVRSRLKSTEPLEIGELLHIDGLADRLKEDLYISHDTTCEIHQHVDNKLQELFDKNPENLIFLTEADLNHLFWGGYAISVTNHIQSLHDHYQALLQAKRADKLTSELSAPSPNLEYIRDLILQKKPPLSAPLCERNTRNFIRLLSQWDACAENTMFVEFFMKEMHHQQLEVKPFISNILSQIKPPSDQGFARGRYLLMKNQLTQTLVFHCTKYSSDTDEE